MFPKSEMVSFNGCWICAGCKPVLVQRIKEGIGLDGFSGVLWRDGNKVVMRLGTEMPERCFRCNEPGFGERIRHIVYWHPPIYLLYLIAGIVVTGAVSAFTSPALFLPGFILLVVVLSIYFQKTVRLRMGVCRIHKRRRFIANTITASFAVVAILVLFCSVEFGLNWVYPTTSGALLLLVLVCGHIQTKLVSPSKVTDEHVWLKGAGREFLASLPIWPGTS